MPPGGKVPTHIDQTRQNAQEGNLFFLCFDHHDEYDGTTRIAKGLTEAEVKTWRYELYKEMELRLAQGGVAKKPKNRVFGLIPTSAECSVQQHYALYRNYYLISICR